LRLLSRQFAVTKLELEAEKAAYLADKLGTTSKMALDNIESVEETNKQSAEVKSAVHSPQELSEMSEILSEHRDPIDSDAVIEKLFPSAPVPLKTTTAERRFNFNPSQLLARDRWSLAWTGFMKTGAEPSSPPVAEAVAAAATTAANLNQNLKSMQVEKPLKWVKPKPKVGIIFFQYPYFDRVPIENNGIGCNSKTLPGTTFLNSLTVPVPVPWE
jgi:hypothetical protein